MTAYDMARANRFQGVGFVIPDGYGVIDLDHASEEYINEIHSLIPSPGRSAGTADRIAGCRNPFKSCVGRLSDHTAGIYHGNCVFAWMFCRETLLWLSLPGIRVCMPVYSDFFVCRIPELGKGKEKDRR